MGEGERREARATERERDLFQGSRLVPFVKEGNGDAVRQTSSYR